MSNYDDNFGFYDMEEEGSEEFYRDVQERSVEKKCKGCGKLVFLLPHYAYCNSCADKIEKGQELEF